MNEHNAPTNHLLQPPPLPCDPPGLGVSNLEWRQYIGLNERHNLAIAIKPYLENRLDHWQVVYAASPQNVTTSPPSQPKPATIQNAGGWESAVEARHRVRPEADLAAGRQGVVIPILKAKHRTRGKMGHRIWSWQELRLRVPRRQAKSRLRKS